MKLRGRNPKNKKRKEMITKKKAVAVKSQSLLHRWDVVAGDSIYIQNTGKNKLEKSTLTIEHELISEEKTKRERNRERNLENRGRKRKPERKPESKRT